MFVNINNDNRLKKEKEEGFIIKSWAKSIKTYEKLSDIESLNYKKIKCFLDKKEAKIYKVSNDLANIQKSIEKNLNTQKIEIDNIVNTEINRIFKEIIYYNYTKRFNVTEEIIIKALVGEDKFSLYYNKLKTLIYVSY